MAGKKPFNEADAQAQIDRRVEQYQENDIKKLDGKIHLVWKKVRSSKHLKEFTDSIKLFVSLVTDYRKGIYRDIPGKSIATIVVALIYILIPLDVLPDFFPLLGLTDDATVVAVTIKMLGDELKKYKDWKNKMGESGDIDDK